MIVISSYVAEDIYNILAVCSRPNWARIPWMLCRLIHTVTFCSSPQTAPSPSPLCLCATCTSRQSLYFSTSSNCNFHLFLSPQHFSWRHVYNFLLLSTLRHCVFYFFPVFFLVRRPFVHGRRGHSDTNTLCIWCVLCMETVVHANVCIVLNVSCESGSILFSFVVFTFSMLSLCSRIAIQFAFVRSVSLSSLHFIYFAKDVVLFPIKMKEKNMFSIGDVRTPVVCIRTRRIIQRRPYTAVAAAEAISSIYGQSLSNSLNSKYCLTPHKYIY